MTTVFQPPPTYADPFLLDQTSGRALFNPIWLKWFVDLTELINNSGGGGGVFTHNALSGLQGGTANQYYHFTAAQHTTLTAITGVGNGILYNNAGTFGARTLTGTANQVIISNGTGAAGNPTFTTPQDIATTSSPTFANLDLSAATDTQVTYVLSGVDKWSLGLDDSDSDAFVLSSGGVIGTTNLFRITSNGYMSLGNSAATFSVGVPAEPPGMLLGSAPRLGLYATGTTLMGEAKYSANSESAVFMFGKSRGASIGTNSMVSSGDSLGIIYFAGTDNTDFRTAASIEGEVDGTPGSGDMPGRLVFKTSADGGSTLGTALTLDQAKNAQFTGLVRTAGITRNTAQFDKTTATLANVTGMTVNVLAAGVYTFTARLFVDTDVIGGHQYAISGTATATAIKYQVNSINNATNTFAITSRQTAMAGAIGEASGTTYYTEISGMITVNAAGTLTVQFAQNIANGTSSVLTGSSFEVTPVS